MKGYEGEACPECAQLHAGAERDVPEVRHVRRDDGVFVKQRGCGGFGARALGREQLAA